MEWDTAAGDAVLRGAATLNAAEQRGLALFTDPAKGNCAACHPAAPRPDGGPPMLTELSLPPPPINAVPELVAKS